MWLSTLVWQPLPASSCGNTNYHRPADAATLGKGHPLRVPIGRAAHGLGVPATFSSGERRNLSAENIPTGRGRFSMMAHIGSPQRRGGDFKTGQLSSGSGFGVRNVSDVMT